jgi:glycosyltransferase involved in cell wall biosynthesis
MVNPAPDISVVIAVRNGEATLQRALDSVFEQTDVDVELIVMDGASTDRTPAILEQNDDRIAYWRSKPDRGVYHAWNMALEHVTGDWVCFLGADDRYHAPDTLARMASVLGGVEHRHRIVYGTIIVVRPDGSTHHAMGLPWNVARKRIRRGQMMIPHPSAFHRRALFNELGPFDERFRIAGDYEFLLRELPDHEPLFVPDIVVDMAAGGMSDRPANRPLIEREMYRARYMHGLERTPAWRSPRLFRRLGRIWLTKTIGPRATGRITDVYRSIFRRRKRRSKQVA